MDENKLNETKGGASAPLVGLASVSTKTASSVKEPQAGKRQAKTPRFWPVVMVVAVLLLSASVIGAALLIERSSDSASLTTRESIEKDGNQVITSEESTISSVVEKVSPSVVSISMEKVDNSSYYSNRVQSGAGSGFIVSKDGVILTNRHVVAGMRNFRVILSNGKVYDSVKVVAIDPLNDIAFLKVSGVKDLPAVELGDSTTIRVGQMALAIGNSLGIYQNTVTKGIISGLGRPISASDGESVEQLTDLLQTDAAINPGNSGGPLLNAGGQVIGINTAIVQNAQSLGFAIPVNAAKGMLKQILAGETNVRRAYLGVMYIPVDVQVAIDNDLSVERGAFLTGDAGRQVVASGSPAEKAGLKKGDVITKVNGVEVGTRGNLSSLISEYAPGDKVKLTVKRGSETIEFTVSLTAFQSES